MDFDALSEWARAADGRAAWLLWGKARPSESDTQPAHPLFCHLLDVAAVARLLLTEVLPPAILRIVLAPLGLPQDQALAWLTFLVATHDLGKASPPFQGNVNELAHVLRAAGFDIPDHGINARHHASLTVPFLAEALERRFGLDPYLSLRLAGAVAAHHGEFPSPEDADHPGYRDAGKEPCWDATRACILDVLIQVTGVDRAGRPDPRLVDDHAFFGFLAGLTSVADWLGSMREVFSYVAPPPSAEAYWELAQQRAARALDIVRMRRPAEGTGRQFYALFGIAPRPLQTAAERLAGRISGQALVLIECPMGEGKTEAALFLADAFAATTGHRGFFVGLPTQATANQMFTRVRTFLGRAYLGTSSNLHLAHGESILVEPYRALLEAVYDPRGRGDVVAEQWFAKAKHTLLAGYAVGTIDQALLGVLHVRHGFVRLYGLSGKVVILDEVHAYDTYTSSLVVRLVEWLHALGASVVLLSATLPTARRLELLRAFGANEAPPPAAYPRITTVESGRVHVEHVASCRPSQEIHLVRVPDDRNEIARALAERVRDGGCAGWICNTVHRSQRAYRAVRRLRDEGGLPRDTKILLIHARFLTRDRARLERQIETWLGPEAERPERVIVIGTQVLEQSLDIDFDLLVTDLAPVDLVLQRTGRLHRHPRRSRGQLTHPELWLICPAGDPTSAIVKDIARVYSPYILRRTLLALERRTHLVLPADIEPLINAVYSDPDPVHAREALARDREEDEEASREERKEALKRMIKSPRAADDPFARADPPLEDDAPALHESLRALTRLGEPSVDVICLFGEPSHAFLDIENAKPVSLEECPSREGTLALLENGVGIAIPGLVQAIMSLPCPTAWGRSPLLKDRRTLFFLGGKCRLNGWVVRLDSEIGLVIVREGEEEDDDA